MTRVLTLCLLTGVLGCGARSAVEEPLPLELSRASSATLGAMGARCSYVTSPRSMPSLSELARPGLRANIALWGGDHEVSDSMEVSVRYDEEGQLAWVRTLHSTIPSLRTTSLDRLILGALEEEGEPGWGFRIRVKGGEVVAVRPSVVCPATIRRGVRRAVAVPRSPEAIATLRQIQGDRIEVLISLDAQGRALHVQLPRSTGVSEVDHFLIEWVMATDFDPMLHDGIPVPVTLRQSLRIPRRTLFRP